jgi:hydrogenase maturation protease
MRTVVLGLGNLIHSDDGIGIHAVEKLRADPHFPPYVTLIDGGTQGLALLPYLSGFQRLLAIDAVDVGEKPGAIVRLEGPQLDRLPGKPSVHQLAFADLMIAMRLLGEKPDEVVLLGVQPQSTDWGVDLTEPVRAALNPLL